MRVRNRNSKLAAGTVCRLNGFSFLHRRNLRMNLPTGPCPARQPVEMSPRGRFAPEAIARLQMGRWLRRLRGSQ